MGKFSKYDKILLTVSVVAAVLASVSVFRLFHAHNVEKRQVVLLELESSNYKRGHHLPEAIEALSWARSLAASCSPEQYARISLDLAGVLEKSGDVRQAVDAYLDASAAYSRLLQRSARQDAESRQVFAEGLCWSNDGILRLTKAANLSSAVELAAKAVLQDLVGTSNKDSSRAFSVRWLELANVFPASEFKESQLEKSRRVLKDYRRKWIERTDLADPEDVRALADCAMHRLTSGDFATAHEVIRRLLSASQSTADNTKATVAGTKCMLAYLDFAYNSPTKNSASLFAQCEPLLSKCSDPPMTEWMRSANYSRFAARAIGDPHYLPLSTTCGNAVCELAARTQSPMKEQMLSLLMGSIGGAPISEQGKLIRSELMRQVLSELKNSDGQFRAACLLQLCNDEITQNDARAKQHILEFSKLLVALPHNEQSVARLPCLLPLLEHANGDPALTQLGLALIESMQPQDRQYPALIGRCAYLIRADRELDRKTIEQVYTLLRAGLEKYGSKYPHSSAATGYVYLTEYWIGSDFKRAMPYLLKAQKLLKQSSDLDGRTKATDLQIMFDNARSNQQAKEPAAHRAMEQLASECLTGRSKAFGGISFEMATTLASIASYEMMCGDKERARSLNNRALAAMKAIGLRQDDGFFRLAITTKDLIEKR